MVTYYKFYRIINGESTRIISDENDSIITCPTVEMKKMSVCDG